MPKAWILAEAPFAKRSTFSLNRARSAANLTPRPEKLKQSGPRRTKRLFGSCVDQPPHRGRRNLQFLRGISNGLMGTSFRLVVREPSRFFAADYVKTDERDMFGELLNDFAAYCGIIERDADEGTDDL